MRGQHRKQRQFMTRTRREPNYWPPLLSFLSIINWWKSISTPKRGPNSYRSWHSWKSFGGEQVVDRTVLYSTIFCACQLCQVSQSPRHTRKLWACEHYTMQYFTVLDMEQLCGAHLGWRNCVAVTCATTVISTAADITAVEGNDVHGRTKTRLLKESSISPRKKTLCIGSWRHYCTCTGPPVSCTCEHSHRINFTSSFIYFNDFNYVFKQSWANTTN